MWGLWYWWIHADSVALSLLGVNAGSAGAGHVPGQLGPLGVTLAGYSRDTEEDGDTVGTHDLPSSKTWRCCRPTPGLGRCGSGCTLFSDLWPGLGYLGGQYGYISSFSVAPLSSAVTQNYPESQLPSPAQSCCHEVGWPVGTGPGSVGL